MQSWKRTLFRLLYVLLSLYTLRHTALGFATLEPDTPFAVAFGFVAAVAVDVGLLLAAELAPGGRRVLAALALSGTVSVFAQLLFAVTHAQPVAVVDAARFMEPVAGWIVNARVFALPFIAPAMIVVYAGIGHKPKQAKPKQTRRKRKPAKRNADAELLALWKVEPLAGPTEAARRLGMSPSGVRHIRKRLEGDGVLAYNRDTRAVTVLPGGNGHGQA